MTKEKVMMAMRMMMVWFMTTMMAMTKEKVR